MFIIIITKIIMVTSMLEFIMGITTMVEIAFIIVPSKGDFKQEWGNFEGLIESNCYTLDSEL